jgi:hypothetical protein
MGTCPPPLSAYPGCLGPVRSPPPGPRPWPASRERQPPEDSGLLDVLQGVESSRVEASSRTGTSSYSMTSFSNGQQRKGKPIARWGRKVTGPPRASRTTERRTERFLGGAEHQFRRRRLETGHRAELGLSDVVGCSDELSSSVSASSLLGCCPRSSPTPAARRRPATTIRRGPSHRRLR